MLQFMTFSAFAVWCASAIAYTALRRRTSTAGGLDRSDGWMGVFMASRMDEDSPRLPSGSGGEPPTLPPELAIRAWLLRPGALEVIRRWCIRLLVPKQDSRDLAQDVVVAAVRSAPQYDPARGRPERWVNSIAVNVVAKWRSKARHRREVLQDDEELEERAAELPPADERIEAEQARIRTIDAIQRLPPRDAAIIVGHDLDERMMDDVAKEGRIPISTAYRRRRHAFALLAELLREG